MRVYSGPAEGLADAQRLAEGMTQKWAALDLPFGGGKAVLAVPRALAGAEREGLLRRYGVLLESLSGGFQTGVDLGTTPADMAVVGQVTRNVHGVDFSDGSTIDPGPFTARGVLRGIEAALEAVFGDSEPAGRTILVQGLGDVGLPLARLLAEAGASLLVSDLVPERTKQAAAEMGATVVDPEAILSTTCDVYAPCATGGVLDRETIPVLACRIVAGSANVQLAEPTDAERLHERRILYAPDYIVNGGGAGAFGLLALGVQDRARILAKVDGIGTALREIFREAAERGESPVHAAGRRVERILARGRESRVETVSY
jgi:leucine dehydrogenase